MNSSNSLNYSPTNSLKNSSETSSVEPQAAPRPTRQPLKPSLERAIVKPNPTESSAASLMSALPLQKSSNHLVLLQGVMECLPDGIMIVTTQGDLTYENSGARRICQLIRAESASPSPCVAVPLQIWQCCRALIDSRNHYQASVIIEDEIHTKLSTIRMRVRWLHPDDLEQPLLLVTLEDQQQSAQYRAYAEAHRYGLTERETEVWLLKRAGLTYKAIGAKLHITEDTVKKHIKNIHARRDASLWANS